MSKSRYGTWTMKDIHEDVVCFIVMVSNGIVTPQASVQDSDDKFNKAFDMFCELCPAMGNCALWIYNNEQGSSQMSPGDREES